MRYEFDAKVYRKYGLISLAMNILFLAAIIVATNVFLVVVKDRELPLAEPTWLWWQLLIPFIFTVLRYIYQYFSRRANVNLDYIIIEQGTDGEPTDVSMRVQGKDYLIESITALRGTLTGDVIVRGVILRMDGAQCIDKKKKLVIAPCFRDMDGILKSLERYQRVLSERAWEEVHDTRI